MASNAWIMWENVLPDATTVTESVAATAGWPLSHATDNWNPGTAYRYALPGTSTATNVFNFGAGVTKEPDTIVGGAYSTDGTRIIRRVRYSDDGAAWFNAAPISGWEDLTGLTQPFATSRSWTGLGDHQYWEILMQGGANRQIGLISLGRKFEIGVGGLPPSFEPFPDRVQAERVMSHSGHPLGANVTSIQRTFTLDISNPGLAVSTFYEPASGLTWADFLAHAQGLGKPFWFCWNPDDDYPLPAGAVNFGFLNSIFLCRLISAPTPIEWTTARRGLSMTIAAYNRAA